MNIVQLPLAQYYNLKNTILVEKGEEELIITVQYKKNYPMIHFNIPYELNKIIHSYRGDFIEIKASLQCPKFFPFVSPIWKLIEVNNNLYNNGIITLQEYYETIISQLNNSNTQLKNWSPIYGFEKEILRFFMRINHFESVVENL